MSRLFIPQVIFLDKRRFNRRNAADLGDPMCSHGEVVSGSPPILFYQSDIGSDIPVSYRSIYPFVSNTSVFCSPSLTSRLQKGQTRAAPARCRLFARPSSSSMRRQGALPRCVWAIVSSRCNHPWYLNPHDLLKDGLHCKLRIEKSVCANCQRATPRGEPEGGGGTLSANYVRGW